MRARFAFNRNRKSKIAIQEDPMAATVHKVLTKIFGSRNERLLKRYRRIVEQINELEPKVQAMTDEQLRARTQELRDGHRRRQAPHRPT